jgi:hypothetical protein
MPSGTRVATKDFIVNDAHLSALSALAGSAIGGMASIATTRLTEHSQKSCQYHAQSMARRVRLCGDFTDKASKMFIDALIHEQIDPPKFVEIYAAIGKLRLFASADVMFKTDRVSQDIGETYCLPTWDFTKPETSPKTELNMLQAFSEVCRGDLRD